MRMSPQQVSYEHQLKCFLGLALNHTGLFAKLATFDVTLDHQEKFGEELWEAAPAMFTFARALQIDLTLSIARLLEEPNGRFKSTSIKRFLDFAAENAAHIKWADGPIDVAKVDSHLGLLEDHADVIGSIKGQRDKGLAHLEKKYFLDPEALEADYPIDAHRLRSLCGSLATILREHEMGLNGGASVSGFWSSPHVIHTDRMLNTLIEAKRRGELRKG